MSSSLADHNKEMRRIYGLIRDAFTGYDQLDESEDGYAMLYRAGEPMGGKLAQFRDEFRKRYPAIEVELDTDEADGRHRLRIGGTAISKQFVAGLLVSAQTGGLKLPSPARTKAIQWYRRATSRIRVLPSFLIIGAPRCGTTSLYEYLSMHPRVLPAVTKELGFFDLLYAHGPAAYRSSFPLRTRRPEPGARRGDFKTGEATPTYLHDPRVPQRVHDMLPNVKLIVMLRNPVERAFSHYHFSVRNGLEALTFEEAIESEPERMAGELEKMAADGSYWSEHRIFRSYATTGVYVDHLDNWTKVFPREQMHVVGMEEFGADSPGEFRRILEFIELPEFRPAQFKTMNTFPYPNLAQATRERLAEYFRPHNERLFEFLGKDYGWNETPAPSA